MWCVFSLSQERLKVGLKKSISQRLKNVNNLAHTNLFDRFICACLDFKSARLCSLLKQVQVTFCEMEWSLLRLQANIGLKFFPIKLKLSVYRVLNITSSKRNDLNKMIRYNCFQTVLILLTWYTHKTNKIPKNGIQ